MADTENTIHVEGILSSALQVYLRISMWHGYVRDQEVEHKVVESAKADDNAAIFYKKLSACPLFKKYKKLVSKARKQHYLLTMPWLDNGVRILPASLLLEYKNRVESVIDLINAEARYIASNRDALNEYAKIHLGELYKESDVPTASDLERAFGASVEFWPMPKTGEWRIEAEEQLIKEMDAKLNAQIEQRYKTALSTTGKKILDCARRLHKALLGKRLHASTVEAFNELLDLIPHLNISNDAEVNRIHRQLIESVGDLDVEDLRADRTLRTRKAAKLGAIIASMEAKEKAA